MPHAAELPETLNEDLANLASMQGAELPWLPSPLAGVERRPLYRVGGEQARATSLVRYLPGSRFSPHRHPGGEELLVLEGTFEDEHGVYPAGSYVRNPPGTAHAPASPSGCLMLVRLRQFHPEDRCQQVVMLPTHGDAVLFEDGNERVTVHDLAPGETWHAESRRGLELLVMSGALIHDRLSLQALGWCRLPPGQSESWRAGDTGARLWCKDAALDLGLTA